MDKEELKKLVEATYVELRETAPGRAPFVKYADRSDLKQLFTEISTGAVLSKQDNGTFDEYTKVMSKESYAIAAAAKETGIDTQQGLKELATIDIRKPEIKPDEALEKAFSDIIYGSGTHALYKKIMAGKEKELELETLAQEDVIPVIQDIFGPDLIKPEDVEKIFVKNEKIGTGVEAQYNPSKDIVEMNLDATLSQSTGYNIGIVTHELGHMAHYRQVGKDKAPLLEEKEFAPTEMFADVLTAYVLKELAPKNEIYLEALRSQMNWMKDRAYSSLHEAETKTPAQSQFHAGLKDLLDKQGGYDRARATTFELTAKYLLDEIPASEMKKEIIKLSKMTGYDEIRNELENYQKNYGAKPKEAYEKYSPASYSMEK